jgi:hypothetical protein
LNILEPLKYYVYEEREGLEKTQDYTVSLSVLRDPGQQFFSFLPKLRNNNNITTRLILFSNSG